MITIKVERVKDLIKELQKLQKEQRAYSWNIYKDEDSDNIIAVFDRDGKALAEIKNCSDVRYGKTVKENGDRILLNADGSRSIFCDVDE